jgi:hypothetical protein
MNDQYNIIKEDQTKDKELILLCGVCRTETTHIVLKSISHHYGDEAVDGRTEYQIVQCQGCKCPSFRDEGVFSEDWDLGTGRNVRVHLYPERSVQMLDLKNFYEIPPNLDQIYEEIIACFNQGNRILCAAGLRSLIEGICSVKEIKKGIVEYKDKSGKIQQKQDKGLWGKISGLSENGILTKKNAEFLNNFRFLGNDALHNLSAPSKEELRISIEIVEHILENIFEIEKKVEQLKKQIDKRRSK